MNSPAGPLTARIVILGTGTNVGKTYVTSRLASALGAHPATASVTAIKPIESGTGANGEWDEKDTSLRLAHPTHSDARSRELPTDAALLASVSRPTLTPPAYAYEFADPISPHLAARRSGMRIESSKVIRWVSALERARQPHSPVATDRCERSAANPIHWTLIETAGAAFSPLAPDFWNLSLANLLEPAFWLLVAPDRLGLLHDMTATLMAMRTVARLPDFVVLSQSEAADASTGTNAGELAELGIVEVLATIGRNEAFAQTAVERIVARANNSTCP